MAFFGKYLEVTPHSRLLWTNEEADDGAVTFEDKGGKTLEPRGRKNRRSVERWSAGGSSP